MHYRNLLAACAIFASAQMCFAQNNVELKPVTRSPSVSLEDKDLAEKTAADAAKGWKSLLPKEGLDGWQKTDFSGQGDVVRKSDELVLETGDPLTGITYTKKDFPTNNFEIEVEANRIEGGDFLCGLTFPVGKSFCSFIAGGWGGGLVGLSSVDGYDASENATSSNRDFENGKWYKFRVAVDDQNITAWIDDRQVLEQEREGHEFSTRIEVYANQPLGFCVFRSKVAIRNLRWRPLAAEAGKPEEASDKLEATAVEIKK